VVSVEQPTDKVIIDFLGTGSKRKKDRRACVVTLEVENGQLRVEVKGCDDRATIISDEVYDLPAEDTRR
jgi:hypothetical protein